MTHTVLLHIVNHYRYTFLLWHFRPNVRCSLRGKNESIVPLNVAITL
jgi:hypothetical protein